jgi:uncharacterized protein YjiS (DUF1127 family)
MAAQAITAHDINAVAGRTYPAPEPGMPSLSALLRRLGIWYRQDRNYRETVAELSKLSDQVLADIGINRFEIPAVARTLSRRVA